MMIYHLLGAMGVVAGYIGSGGVRYAEIEEKTENTTPSSLDLHRILADMCRAHVRTVVMEVSSQALISDRVYGMNFPFCVFTNLAADHIGEGEHPDFAHYREAKARLFSDYGCHTVIVNADDASAPYMLAESSAREVWTTSCMARGTSLYADRIRPTRNGHAFGSSFLLHTKEEGEIPVSLSLPGECNVSNALLALGMVYAYGKACAASDFAFRALAPHLCELRIPGRFEPVRTVQGSVDYLIDYAHNGYSLRAALCALRAYAPARLVCLLGSVGARTYSRRTELGEAACEADFCIVTTDNPGTELPEDTMREICRVLDEHGRDYIAISDRAEAIRYAVTHARPGDLVLLSGKGHEDYQLIGYEKIPFSERALLLAAAEEHVPVI
jgi:UDP-N-acetylmuramoyl-L-alanyl-D-glutamate--2,6-diaminopimelate ligase